MSVRTALLAAACLLLAACAGRQEMGRASLLSTRPDPAPFRVLQRSVEGRHCRSLPLFDLRADAQQPDLGLALEDALDGVPGADALADADVSIGTRFLSTCFEVRGDAVALE